jgi:LacI family transcriptional regulator
VSAAGGPARRRGRPREAVTIKDVARRAGVAVGTVSNHLNGTAPVAARTALRVKRAILALGFRPHMGARSLRSRRTHIAGLVLPNISNPFFAEVARAIEHALWEQGVQTMLCDSSQDPERERVHLENLAGRRVDGILMISSGRTPSARLDRMDVPVVHVDRGVEGRPSVVTDNRLGGELAADHLLALGHRRIGVLAGEAHVSNVRERLAGFRAALARRGLSLREQDLVPGPQSLELGHEVARLLRRSRPVTAVFATNDIVAVGAWRKLLELGVRVPGDLSLIGFDDIEMSRILLPPLTTVRQDKEALGRAAAALLLQLIGGGRPRTERILVPPRLMVRGSTARRAGGAGG